MIENYPRLVETAIEFKRFSRRILAENKGMESELLRFSLGQTYCEQPDARVIEIASGYRLEYNQPDDTYYCLKGSQRCKLSLF
jgi:hypothetical protein